MARRLYEYEATGSRVCGRLVPCAILAIAVTLCMAALSLVTAGTAHAQSRDYQVLPVRSGGVLGFLFGSPEPGRYRRRGNEDYSYSPAPRNGSGYRTLCVRMCDGYYWPLSFSTGREGLMRDAQRCETSCEAPAKLFYHYSAGNVESMVDMEGKPYSGLEHAFRYRKEYVSDCKCRPEPWSEAAKQEYERRAEVEATGEPAAAQEGEEKPVAMNPARPAPSYSGPLYTVPSNAWQRPRTQRKRDGFRPFARWFN